MQCLRCPTDMVRKRSGFAFRVYRTIDFSRDVLALQPERLLVIRDSTSGWTDLGNPDRVFDTLKRQKIATLTRVDQPA